MALHNTKRGGERDGLSFRITAKTRPGGGPHPAGSESPINGNAQAVHEANTNTDVVRQDSTVRTRFGIPPSPERDLDRRWACQLIDQEEGCHGRPTGLLRT